MENHENIGNHLNLQMQKANKCSDVALEMADFARTSILSETSMALMHQTNKFPQDVLRVLENMK